jgi:hypothetical protein
VHARAVVVPVAAVLAVPVPDAFAVVIGCLQHLTAVGLDDLAVGVAPLLSGAERGDCFAEFG